MLSRKVLSSSPSKWAGIDNIYDRTYFIIILYDTIRLFENEI